MTVVLVSCVGQKASKPTPAEDLYQSSWFKFAKQYCLSHNHQWFILSARHGLLERETIVEPYNLTLKECSRQYQEVWSQQVFRELQQKINITTALMIFAGLHYRRSLCPRLIRYGYQVEVPMRGLGIGKQLRWLKEHA